jgi:hypothetical protein
MDRRWAVLLVIVMLAALAPSAALAGKAKVMDEITKITWTGEGGAFAGRCSTRVTIDYTVGRGATRLYQIEIWQSGATPRLVGISNKVERDGSVTWAFQNTDYWGVSDDHVPGAPVYVRARLWDSKFVSPLASAETNTYTFSATEACPSGGTLASYQ